MVKGFVFGKFLPFHRGHEALIRFALAKCDVLVTLVCCSDRETLPGEIRKRWIEETFSGERRLTVIVLPYHEQELPNTSVPSSTVANRWSTEFKKWLPDANVVFTSEPYGEFVAASMGIQHIPFDLPRTLVPVSATRIRQDLISNWNYLPAAVKADLSIRVSILGTESTGKTTLSRRLATHYQCTVVTEAGRDLIPDSNSFSLEDLQKVAEEHARRISKALVGKNCLVVLDTDIYITKSYAQFMFNRELPVSTSVYHANRAELVLYLNNDVPFVQDGTRLSESDRNRLDTFHRSVLKESGVDFIEIGGDWEARFQRAVRHIDQTTEKYQQLANRTF